MTFLQDCDRSHSRCHTHRETFTPKRLLRIEDSGKKLSLVLHPQATEYVALSYCWGGDQPAKATKARVDDYYLAIPLLALPATLQDAVHVTASLGFKYLWVDAMCIIQDDPQDLTDQLAVMRKIYRGASITIVASQGTKSTDGFLDARESFRPFALRARSDDVDQMEILVCPQATPLEQAHIFKRGWAFQEWLLSPRLITFGEVNVGLICLESHTPDGGAADQRGHNFVHQRPEMLESKVHPQAWANMVLQYSNLDLTVCTDKLPAIGGLAEEYARSHPAGTYFAGLWEKDFIWQLLWRHQSVYKAQRSQTYSGPTWSWCSIQGALTSFPRDDPSALAIKCILEERHVELESERNPFGRVKTARIVLQGRVRKVQWDGQRIQDAISDDGTCSTLLADIHSTRKEDQHFRFDPDFETVAEPETFLYVVEIARMQEDSWWGCIALVLRECCKDDLSSREDGTLVCERVGYFETKQDWFEHEAIRTMQLTII